MPKKQLGGGGHKIDVIHKENGGISSARNAGLDIAEGEYITFCDDDDIVPAENCYEILYEKAVKSGADFVFAGSKDELPNNKFVFTVPPKKEDVLYNKKDFLNLFVKEIAKVKGMMSVYGVCPKLYKHSLLNGIRFDSRYDSCEDRFFNLLVYEKAEKVLLTQFISYIHLYIDGSASRGGTAIHKGAELRLTFVEVMYSFFERNELLKYSKYIKCFYKWAARQVQLRIFEVIVNCDQEDPLVKKVASALRKEYLLYIHTPKAFFVVLLFYLKQYKFLFGLYRKWHGFKQSLKKLLRR